MPDTVETAIYKLSYDGQDSVRELNAVTSASDEAVASAEKLAVAEEKVDRATRTTTQGLEKLMAKLDPRIRAEQQLAKVREQVSRYEEEGVGSATQRAQVIDLATKKYLNQDDALKRVTEDSKLFDKALELVQGKLTSLGGNAGVAASFAARFAGFGLAAVAVSAAAAAAGYLYDSVYPKAKATEEILGEQARLVGLLKERYEQAAAGASLYYDKATAIADFQGIQNERELKARQLLEARTALGNIGRDVPTSLPTMVPGFEAVTPLDMEFKAYERFAPFASAIQKFQEGVDRGLPDVKTFREEVVAIGATSPSLHTLTTELLGFTDAVSKLDPEKLAKTREELERTTQINAQKGFQSALNSLLQVDPDENKAVLRQAKLLELADKRAEAFKKIDESEALFADRLTLRAQVESAYQTAVAKTIKDVPQAADKYQTLTQQITDNIEELELQERSAGRTTQQVTKLKTEHDLLRAAMKAGREITPELRQEVDLLSDSYARMTERVSRAKLIGDLHFERDQLGRDQTEQTVASRLRGAGLPVDLGGDDAALVRATENMKMAKDVASDFGSSFSRDVVGQIRNGTNAWQAFGNAGLSALQRLQDRILDMTMNKAVSAVFGSLFQTQGSNGLATDAVNNGSGIYTGPAWQAGFTRNANGNAFYSGNIIPFARGGVVDRPTIFPMANGAGLMGEAGPEAVMPLRRGSDGRLGVSTHGGSQAAPVLQQRVIIHNYGADVQQRRNEDGDLEIAVRSVTRDEMASGRTNGINRTKYGTSPRLTARG